MVRMIFAVLLSACAADVATTNDGASPTGIYHRPMTADAFNLELRADNTFRWSVSGCDSFGGGEGRVSVESKDEIVLLPAEGKTTFLWNGPEVAGQVPELRLVVTPDRLIESKTRRAWDPGGVCSICGGNLGPTGQEACDEPSFYEVP